MAKLKYNADTPLYTSDSKAWRLDELPEVLDMLFASHKPVVLFVHGRGKEPNKSLNGSTFTTGKAVHKIELGYGVRVLMFNWDSAFKGLNVFDREVPLSHTPAGAVALGIFLKGWSQYAAAHPAVAKPCLLVHSMGSIVLQRSVQDGHWPGGQRLFSSIVLSQPDADERDHAAWLERLAKQERVFVTLNRDDNVLKKSNDARPIGTHALGLGVGDVLAPSATYIDLSRMGPVGDKDDDHEVFGKGAMDGQLCVCQFFSNALTGKPVPLEVGVNVESVEREVIYRLTEHRDPGATCLKIPKLPGD